MAALWTALGPVGVLARFPTNELLLTTLALAGALLLAALAIKLADRWRKRPADEVLTPAEQLAQFRALQDQGEISAEEFERIRARLEGQLSQEVQAKTSAAEGTPQPPGRPETGIRPSDPA